MRKKEKPFVIHTFEVECSREVHLVRLFANGRLDFSDHRKRLGIDRIEEELAEHALQVLAGEQRKPSGCEKFRLKWGDSIRNNRSLYHMDAPGGVRDYVEAGQQRNWKVDEVTPKKRALCVAQSVVRRLIEYARDKYDLKGMHYVEPQFGNIYQGDIEIDFDFSRWYRHVYRKHRPFAITPNRLFTADMCRIGQRGGMSSYALAQLSVFYQVKEGYVERGYAHSIRTELRYALVHDETGEIIGIGSHPKAIELGVLS